MMVVHLSTSCRGGAGIAAVRHHVSLLETGVDSHFISRDSAAGIQNAYQLQDIYPANALMKSRLKIYAQRLGLPTATNASLSRKYLKNRDSSLEYFSFPFSNFYLEEIELIRKADIIHLHWIADDFINPPTFFKALKDKAMVWTLHDMNPFTGGCHHSDGHEGFVQSCSNCPQLPAPFHSNVAAGMLRAKRKAYGYIKNLTLVTPSQWLRSLSEKSAAFSARKHFTIPNRVDERIFQPSDKSKARQSLGLPQDKRIVLFVSHTVYHRRKGIATLLQAMERLNGEAILCSAGSKGENNADHIQLGYVHDDKTMSLAYSAADVFVLPSFAENYPNTIAESLLCGTPVVACNTGGIPEQVGKEEGLLVKPSDAAGLTEAIRSILNSPQQFPSERIRSNALQKLSYSATTAQYISLYNNIAAE